MSTLEVVSAQRLYRIIADQIEDKIRDMIKKQLDDSTNKPTGLITDKSA